MFNFKLVFKHRYHEIKDYAEQRSVFSYNKYMKCYSCRGMQQMRNISNNQQMNDDHFIK